MKKVSNDYKKLIDQLDSLKNYCSEMARQGRPQEACKDDVEALQEAMDILSDYEKVVAELNRLTEQYEMPAPARKAANNMYSCPNCGRRIQYNHTHCHWCGKRVCWK